MGVFSDLHQAFKVGNKLTNKPGLKAVTAAASKATQEFRQTQIYPWSKVTPKNNQVVAWSGHLPHLPPRWYHWFYLCALDRPTADSRYSPRLKPDYTHELYLGVLSLDTQERRILFHSQFQVPLPSSGVTAVPTEAASLRDKAAEKIGDLFAQMVGATKGVDYLLYPHADWWIPILQACYRRITQQMAAEMDYTAG